MDIILIQFHKPATLTAYFTKIYRTIFYPSPQSPTCQLSSVPHPTTFYTHFLPAQTITTCWFHYKTDLPTYLLTPWCKVLLEKLTGLLLVKKFPTFHRTRRFITALTSVRHLSLSWASPNQSIYPHPTSWRSILILFTHLGLGLTGGSFPPVSPPRTFTAPSPHPYAPHAQPISFFAILSPAQYWARSTNHLAPRNAISSPVTSSLLGPNILLNTMISNTLSFLSSRNVSNQVSCP